VTKAHRNSWSVLRKDRVLGVLVAAGLVILGLSMAALRKEQIFTGPFRVVDGDTLAAGDRRLRLLGIDAPELPQTCGGVGAQPDDWPCGRRARRALFQLIAEGAPECRGSSVDRYGRFLVVCKRGADSINAAMVRAGMAVATGRGAYDAEQALAQKERAGFWLGRFETPRLWRQSQGLQQDDEDAGQIWQRVTEFLQAPWT
jgi:endonuclease YncB( thermonuclease family)